MSDGSNTSLYINGEYKDQYTGTCLSTINFDTGRIRNVDGDRASEYLQGYISNIKIYNRDLSLNEIISNYFALKKQI